MRIYVIAPRRADPQFSTKRAVLEEVAREGGHLLIHPEYDPDAPSFDLAAAIEALRQSDLVLADLSFERPSCYFELGLAEALGAPAKLIAEAGTPIHQSSHRDAVRLFSSIGDYRAAVAAACAG